MVIENKEEYLRVLKEKGATKLSSEDFFGQISLEMIFKVDHRSDWKSIQILGRKVEETMLSKDKQPINTGQSNLTEILQWEGYNTMALINLQLSM